MFSLESLDLLLAISEAELIEELIVGLLAAPALTVFFEKFPRLRRALTKDLPEWKLRLRQRIHETPVPHELAKEFYLFQHCQQLDATTFQSGLASLIDELVQLSSPFATEARTLQENNETSRTAKTGNSFHTLFLQRWRLNLTFQTVNVHHQLLEQEQEQLQEELLQRLQLSSELSPLLAENDTAAGRLWDMSKGKRLRGDIQSLARFGAFLQQQPELMHLAEQLGRSQTVKTSPHEDAKMETLDRKSVV